MEDTLSFLLFFSSCSRLLSCKEITLADKRRLMLTCLCCLFLVWPFYLFFFLFSGARLAKPVVKGVVATGAEGARGAAAGAVSGAIKGVLEGVAGSAPSAEHGAACAEKKK